jgi:hypothetical protein
LHLFPRYIFLGALDAVQEEKSKWQGKPQLNLDPEKQKKINIFNLALRVQLTANIKVQTSSTISSSVKVGWVSEISSM